MKKGVVVGVITLFLMAMMPACGGGGPDDTANDAVGAIVEQPTTPVDDVEENEAVEESTQPEIIDEYYDIGSCKYADPTLYNGTYTLVMDPQETCSILFDTAMDAEAIVSGATENSVSITLMQETVFWTKLSDEILGDFDGWGYESLNEEFYCLAIIATGNEKGETLDVVGFGCLDRMNPNDNCTVLYQRDALRDLSNTYIKSVKNAAHSVQDALLDVLDDIQQ